jgi:CheY-like chemotaxis protein
MLRVLLVEDNLADQRLAQEEFRSLQTECELEISPDGSHAVKRLASALEDASELPDLILLDLNLPRLNGREVLRWVKSEERLKHIPVLMLSSSTLPEDIQACYDLHANCYLFKPMDVDSFFELIHNVEALWFPQVARLRERAEALAPFLPRPTACISRAMASA